MLKKLLSILIVWPVVGIIFLLALLRVSLINLDFVKPELEAWLNNEFMQGISFEEISGEWRQINPVLSLRKVSVSSDQMVESLNIDQIELEIDALSSLLTGNLVIHDIDGTVDHFTIVKDKNKVWSVNGIPISAENSDGDVNITSLLSAIPRNLNIHINLLRVQDMLSETNYDVRGVESSIQLLDQIFHIKLYADLPQQLGKQLSLVGRFRHDFSHAYLELEDIAVLEWAELLDTSLTMVEKGRLNGQFWLSLYKPDLINVSGKFAIDDLQIGSGKAVKPVAVSLDQQFNLTHSNNQWILQSSIEDISVDGKNWDAFSTQLRWQPANNDQVDGWISAMEIGPVLGIASRLADIPEVEQLRKTKARGQLDDAFFSFPLRQPELLRLSTEINNLSSVAASPFPGVKGFSGEVVIDDGKASFELSAKKAKIDFTDQFRVPFDINKLNLSAHLNWQDKRWILQATDTLVENSDLKYQGRLWLEGEADANPFMYIRAKFKDGKGSSTSKYIPIKIMPEEATQWIDDGIVDATVPTGDFIFHGRLQQLENYADHMLGEFKITFDVEAAEVSFAPDWPSAIEGFGQIAFHNMAMNIDLSSVSYQSIEKGTANIQIKDFRDSELYVSAQTLSSLQPAFDTWFSLPVGEDYVSVFEPVVTRNGQVKSQIDLMVPLTSDNNQVLVDIKLDFKDAELEAPDWGVSLSHINGRLAVTDSIIQGDNINARLFGDPIEVNVATDEVANRSVVDANGNVSTRNLMKLLPDYLRREVEGRSQWDVNLSIANSIDLKQGNILEIDAASNLIGTSLSFPYPAGKSANVSRQISTRIELAEDSSIEFNVESKNGIRTRGFLQKENSESELTGIDIVLNNRLKDTIPDGFRIYGVTDYFPLSDWIEVVNNSVNADDNESKSSIDVVDSIYLESKKVDFIQREFTDVRFSMTRKDGYFATDLMSKEAMGSAVIPIMSPQVLPVIIDMDYLQLSELGEGASSSEIFPQDLFDVDVNVDKFIYGEKHFTDMDFQARISENQLDVNNFSILHEQVVLKMNGNWRHDEKLGQHLTNLDLTVKGKKVGQAVMDLGYGDFLQDGKIDLTAQIGWADDIFSFDVDTLLGKAKLKIEDGVLKNVDPGSGRLVGLFSLNALPRRLSLDFKDILVSGLEFEKISGDYEINDGKLMTMNTRMKGESAKIKIEGETDLANRQYNQKMIVTPQIGNTLPVLGSIAAGNAVGWGLLLLKSIFRKQIDETVQLYYQVTGSWDDPELVLVNEEEFKKPLDVKGEKNEK